MLLLFPDCSWAFPEMIRHGYSNCTTCHVSQTGGGVLTVYGRELSRELLSVWKNSSDKSKEHQFAFGAVTVADWLQMGGDVRTVYVYQDDLYRTNGRTILMQADLEGAATKNNLTFDATLGYRDPKGSDKFSDALQSRRHYLSYSMSDTWSLRGGRFLSAYGINTSDHVSVVKRSLGLGQGFETYNLELSYIAEKLNLFLTGNFGRPDDSTLNRDSGSLAQGSYLLGESYKVGLNLYSGKNTSRRRTMFGAFGLLGITEKIALLTEFDFQSALTDGVATTQKLSYEASSGVWFYLNQEWMKLDFKNELSETDVYGVGAQLFPRAHFEINLAWNWKKDYSYANEYYSYAWLMAHLYF
jgi:hypothetical protein